MNAAEITAIVAGIVSIFGAIGAVGKFVWNKIEARFTALGERIDKTERDLDECRERSDLSEKRRSVLITIIEVLKQEFRHHLPDSKALTRADELMDEYRSLKPTDKP